MTTREFVLCGYWERVRRIPAGYVSVLNPYDAVGKLCDLLVVGNHHNRLGKLLARNL